MHHERHGRRRTTEDRLRRSGLVKLSESTRRSPSPHVCHRIHTATPATLGLHETFALLADKTRLRLLLELRAGERNVSDLTDELALPQPTVSHHLMILRQMGTVVSRRDGKRVFYALGDTVTAAAGGGLRVACYGGTTLNIRERVTDVQSGGGTLATDSIVTH